MSACAAPAGLGRLRLLDCKENAQISTDVFALEKCSFAAIFMRIAFSPRHDLRPGLISPAQPRYLPPVRKGWLGPQPDAAAAAHGIDPGVTVRIHQGSLLRPRTLSCFQWEAVNRANKRIFPSSYDATNRCTMMRNKRTGSSRSAAVDEQDLEPPCKVEQSPPRPGGTAVVQRGAIRDWGGEGGGEPPLLSKVQEAKPGMPNAAP